MAKNKKYGPTLGHENLKGAPVPGGNTQDRRAPETKPRKSGKGGVGSGSGVMGPGTLGR